MGRSPEEFLAAAEAYNGGDMAWIATATVFCWSIIPGVGMLYSGYTNRKNALATVWTSLITMSVSSVSWMLLGYSIAYGPGNSFIGDATLAGHKGVLDVPVYAIPEMLYTIFQLVFCVATVAIFMGGAAERARLSCIPVLAFFWPLLVYCPIAHWTWSSTGWLYTLGAYDFAGGSPVHIASGVGALAFSTYLSHPLFRSRKSAHRSLKVLVEHKPHNLMQLTLAYILIVSGWLAFDGGSTLGLNLRSFVAMNTTQMSGCMGAFTHSLLHFLYTGKWSLAQFITGSISGLVAITPGCGYVGMPASLLFGVLGSIACFYAAKFKHTAFARRIKFSDPADVFGCHAIGGIVGNLLTGIFAQAEIAATDGASVIPGGWLDGHYIQLGYQLADCCAVTLYAFGMTYILVAIIDCVPGLEVLATDEDIIAGMDYAGNGESYGDEQWKDEAEWHPFLGNSIGGDVTPKDEEKGSLSGQTLKTSVVPA
ncbi:putative ammonium transporter [Meredithblackwellia eburnea MCA 4105]